MTDLLAPADLARASSTSGRELSRRGSGCPARPSTMWPAAPGTSSRPRERRRVLVPVRPVGAARARRHRCRWLVPRTAQRAAPAIAPMAVLALAHFGGGRGALAGAAAAGVPYCLPNDVVDVAEAPPPQHRTPSAVPALHRRRGWAMSAVEAEAAGYRALVADGRPARPGLARARPAIRLQLLPLPHIDPVEQERESRYGGSTTSGSTASPTTIPVDLDAVIEGHPPPRATLAGPPTALRRSSP